MPEYLSFLYQGYNIFQTVCVSTVQQLMLFLGRLARPKCSARPYSILVLRLPKQPKEPWSVAAVPLFALHSDVHWPENVQRITALL